MGNQALSANDKIARIMHLSAQDILLYTNKTLNNTSKELIDRHLTVCKDCRTRMQLVTRMAGSYGHPSAREQVGTLFYKARARIGKAVKGLFAKVRSLGTAKPVWAFAPVVLLVFIAISILLSLPFSRLTVFEGKEITRYKGLQPYINIYRKASDSVEVLKDSSIVEEKNNIQLSYVACDMKYGMIFSFDGNGYLTMHYPAQYESSHSLALDNKGEIFLPHSFIFDDAPAFERFFFVTSEEEFSPDTVVTAARKLIKTADKGQTSWLDLPLKFKQSSITLLKKKS